MFSPEIIKPLLYKAFYKFVLAIAVILVWHRFINQNSYYGIFDTGFFVVGVFYLMLAWMNYLSLDGIKLHGLNIFKVLFHMGDKNTRQKKNGSMMDFVQQDLPDYDNLSKEDKSIVIFGANLLTGLIMTLASFAYIAFAF